MRAAALALALATAACASGPFASPKPTPREAELERRLLAVEKDATKSRLEIERLRQRLAELEARGTPAPAAAAPVPAPPVVEPRPARPAPVPPPLTPGARTSAIEESDLEDESGPMPVPPAGPVAPPVAAPPAAPAAPPAAASDDEARQYETALAPLREGRPAEAETALQGFVAAHPGSELADNAWYWIGEARLMRQDVGGALAAFRTAVESYPEGNKTPDSLFKLGHCLALQGDRERAVEVWSELARRFPSTAAAERAREALEAP